MARLTLVCSAPRKTPVIERPTKAIVKLANGQPAYTRNRYVSQSDIDRHGSYAAARKHIEEIGS